MSKNFDTRPLSPALGAEIIGLDVSRDIDADTAKELADVWADNIVLLFRKPDMSQEEQLRFASCFGEVGQRPKPIEKTNEDYSELDTADFERNFRANTTGLLVTAQVFAADMVEAGGGSIIITGNTGARRGIPNFVGFAPTKASQMILGESLARELGPQNVHVAYVIIDALIDMPFVRKRMPDEPAESLANPDDIAGEVFHIAHQPRSTWSYLHEIRPFGEKW